MSGASHLPPSLRDANRRYEPTSRVGSAALPFAVLRKAIEIFVAAAISVSVCAPALAADRIRLALQKTGTGAWELAVITALKLDKEAGLDLVVTELANTEAGKIAIQGGSADVIISDWLWVARERAQGGKLAFYPHSTAIGAVMTKDPAIRSVADLSGKTLGVAGGPVDKSWLLLKAYALRQGVDLEKAARISYGAPPLLAEKAAQGHRYPRCRKGPRRNGRADRHRLCVRRRFREGERRRARAVLRRRREGQAPHRDRRKGLAHRRRAHPDQGQSGPRHLP
jgi:hypothetical protein